MTKQQINAAMNQPEDVKRGTWLTRLALGLRHSELKPLKTAQQGHEAFIRRVIDLGS